MVAVPVRTLAGRRAWIAEGLDRAAIRTEHTQEKVERVHGGLTKQQPDNDSVVARMAVYDEADALECEEHCLDIIKLILDASLDVQPA